MKELYIENKNLPISLEAIEKSIDDLFAYYNFKTIKKILIIPPDFTRFHSMAGDITQLIYFKLCKYIRVDIMPALGTHMPMSEKELKEMFGNIPKESFLVHDWINDIVKIGTIPKEFTSEITNGLIEVEIDVDINKKVIHGGYDLILSIGQVVPHEVVGMANYSKNILVGVGGRQLINKSHMVSAIYGIEKTLGKEKTPARMIFDYAQEHFLKDIPIVYIHTVTTIRDDKVQLNGLYIGNTRKVFEKAVELARQLNITYIDRPIKKIVAYLDEFEFKTTWVGNKGIYRTRMAIADGGELVLLAPGIKRFGENEEIDNLIRKFGYRGRDYILNLLEKGNFGEGTMVAAHLIHGSSDGRFSISYATKSENLDKKEIESVGYNHIDIQDAINLYNPSKLKEGFNVLDNGEEIYYIKNPALGLWMLNDKLC